MFTLDFLQLRPTIMPNSVNCNLRCLYCYCERTKETSGNFMNEKTMKIVIKKFIKAYPKFISFCWHGGEPLLKGVSFYEKVCNLQKQYKLKNQEIENGIQTNATLIDEAWADFFKKFRFKIGVSIDGPELINDAQRKDIDEGKTFFKIMKGIYFLRKKDLQFSVIIVITNRSVKYPEKIYRFIKKEKFFDVKLNPCFGNNPFSVDFKEYANFMNSIFDFWFKEDDPKLSISYFEDIIKWFIGGKPNICHFCNSCYRHVRIDYSGDVLPCDGFLGRDFKLGNLLKQDLEDIVRGTNYKKFFYAVTKIIPYCQKCEWVNLCNGGCSQYSFRGNFHKYLNAMCESRKLIFEHIRETLKI